MLSSVRSSGCNSDRRQESVETKCVPRVAWDSRDPGLAAERDSPERLQRKVSLMVFEDGRGCDFTGRWPGAGEGAIAGLRRPREPLWDSGPWSSPVPSLLRAKHKGNGIVLRKGAM